MENSRSVFLVRHSEAQKTLADVHGGAGTPLTDGGRADTILLAGELNRIMSGAKKILIFSGPRPQTAETAKIIERYTARTHVVLKELVNLNMGVLDGLSTAESWRRYPNAMQNLDEWRAGKRSTDKLELPGGENYIDFSRRILIGLNKVSLKSSNPVIVVTRSVGVAITNLLLTSGQLNVRTYQRYRFDPGSITRLDRQTSGFELCLALTEVPSRVF